MSSLLVGLGLGFVLAAQVGPVTLLIVRSVLRGGRALAVGLAMAGAVVPAAAPASATASARPAALLLAGVAGGTLASYGGFAAAVALARRKVGPRVLAWIHVGVGGALVGFAGLLAHRALEGHAGEGATRR
jgi:threonine/homoserine/homoserine lactone efflux protein